MRRGLAAALSAGLTAVCAATGLPIEGLAPKATAQPAAQYQAAQTTEQGTDNGTWVADTARAHEHGPSDETRLTVTLTDIPELGNGASTIAPGQEMTWAVKVRNDGKQTIRNISVTPQRGNALSAAVHAQEELVAPSSSFGYYGKPTEVSSLAPGQEMTLRLVVPTKPGADGTLSLSDGGVYPMLLSAMAGGQLLDTERFLIPVKNNEPRKETEDDKKPSAVNVLFPLSAPVDIVPGETAHAPEDTPLVLSDDSLASQLSSSGRLNQLVDIYREKTSGELGKGACLAVDPALIDAVDRMTRGYHVSSQRPDLEPKKRLRDSWGSKDQSLGVPGAGENDAKAWLDKVRDIAKTSCVTTLPWASTNVDAVAATGDTWLQREALQRGPAVLQRVLGTTGETNLVIPPSGVLHQDTIPSLREADFSASVITTGGMSSQWEAAQRNQTVNSPNTPKLVNALVAGNTIASGAQHAELAPGINAVAVPGPLSALLAGTGDYPRTPAYSSDSIRYNLPDDSSYARDLTAGAAVRLHATATTTGTQPTMAMLPASVNPGEASRVLDSLRGLIDDEHPPISLQDYLRPAAGEKIEKSTLSVPFSEPASYGTADIEQARHQEQRIDDLTRILSNDPALALTRYTYTLPLRRDILNAFASPTRDSQRGYPEAEGRTHSILANNDKVVGQLRSSISLIPPGGVYTRTSGSSPLPIVAENRLPLPVDAKIQHDPIEGGTLNTPETVHIPPSGSITVSLTADLPKDADSTRLRLWLATTSGTAISDPVDVAVQTRTATSTIAALGAIVGVALLLGVIIRVRRQHRPPPGDDEPESPAARSDSPPPSHSP